MTKRLVVIDVANILRDDRGRIIRDQDGKRLTQMRPENLVSTINFIEENGGEVMGLLRKGTYYSGKRKQGKEDPRYGDWDLVEQAISSDKVQVVSDDDDMYCILYALQNDALLLSMDKFRDHKKANPEVNWDKLTQLQVSDYNFIKGDFISPSLSKKLNDSKGQKVAVPKSNKNEKKTKTSEPKSSKKTTKLIIKPAPATDDNESKIDEIILLDELYAILYSLTSDDGQCNLSAVLEELFHELLSKGKKRGKKMPQGWTTELKKYINKVTDVDRKVTTWVRVNLPSGFELNHNHSSVVRFN